MYTFRFKFCSFISPSSVHIFFTLFCTLFFHFVLPSLFPSLFVSHFFQVEAHSDKFEELRPQVHQIVRAINSANVPTYLHVLVDLLKRIDLFVGQCGVSVFYRFYYYSHYYVDM